MLKKNEVSCFENDSVNEEKKKQKTATTGKEKSTKDESSEKPAEGVDQKEQKLHSLAYLPGKKQSLQTKPKKLLHRF